VILTKGDIVQATYEDRIIRARVMIASPNGRALVIAWDDGMMGGHVGMMPVFQLETGEYYSLIENKPIALVRVDA